MFRKPIALVVSLFYFLMNVPLLYATQNNLWREREAARQYASLPTLIRPTTPFAELLKQIPAVETPLSVIAAAQLSAVRGESGDFRTLLQSIPANAGKIKRVVMATPTAPAVVLIQDVHMNVEAQRNIVTMMKSLSVQTADQPLLIGVEGASGRFDFSKFHSLSDAKLTADVAGSYLNQNRISAPSYFGVTSPASLARVTGIDDSFSYNANVAAYVAALRGKSALVSRLEVRRQTLLREKAAALNPSLRKYDACRSSYENGQTSFGDYLLSLQSAAGPFGLPTDLALEQFSAVYAMEKTLKLAEVERQRARVVEELARSLKLDELKALTADSVAYQTGRLSYAGYYRAIQRRLQAHSISLAQFPAFENYLRYVLLADSISAEKLMQSMQQLERAVLSRLCKTPQERTLMAQSRQLFLRQKLLDFALTPDEWGEYKGSMSSAEMRAFEQFYEHADVRSQRMVSNLMTEMKGHTAVMLVGGFHTPQVTELLKQRGVSFAVVQPNLTQIDGGSGTAYLSIFSREKAPLEKLIEGQRLFLAPSQLLAGNVAGRGVADEMQATATALLEPLAMIPLATGVYATAQTATPFGMKEVSSMEVAGHGRVRFVSRWVWVLAASAALVAVAHMVDFSALRAFFHHMRFSFSQYLQPSRVHLGSLTLAVSAALASMLGMTFEAGEGAAASGSSRRDELDKQIRELELMVSFSVKARWSEAMLGRRGKSVNVQPLLEFLSRQYTGDLRYRGWDNYVHVLQTALGVHQLASAQWDAETALEMLVTALLHDLDLSRTNWKMIPKAEATVRFLVDHNTAQLFYPNSPASVPRAEAVELRAILDRLGFSELARRRMAARVFSTDWWSPANPNAPTPVQKEMILAQLRSHDFGLDAIPLRRQGYELFFMDLASAYLMSLPREVEQRLQDLVSQRIASANEDLDISAVLNSSYWFVRQFLGSGDDLAVRLETLTSDESEPLLENFKTVSAYFEKRARSAIDIGLIQARDAANTSARPTMVVLPVGGGNPSRYSSEIGFEPSPATMKLFRRMVDEETTRLGLQVGQVFNQSRGLMPHVRLVIEPEHPATFLAVSASHANIDDLVQRASAKANATTAAEKRGASIARNGLPDSDIDLIIRELEFDGNFSALSRIAERGALRETVRAFVREGSLVSIDADQDLYQNSGRRMYAILAGQVQLIRTARTELERAPDFDGPLLSRGSTVGAFATAMQLPYDGELRTKTPVIALTLDGAQYARLLRVVLDDVSAPAQNLELSEQDMERLLEYGLVGAYPGEASDIFYVMDEERAQRSIDERTGLFATAEKQQAEDLYKRFGRFNVVRRLGERWLLSEHPLHEKIWNAQKNRHFLKTNFLARNDYVEPGQDRSILQSGMRTFSDHDGRKLSALEWLSIFRNTEEIRSAKTGWHDFNGDVFLVASPDRLMLDNVPIEGESPLAALALSVNGNEIRLALPYHGVLDPVALLAEAMTAGLVPKVALDSKAAETILTTLRFKLENPSDLLRMYRLDTNMYRENVSNIPDYNIDSFLNNLPLQNFDVDPAAVATVKTQVIEAENLLKTYHRSQHTDLSFDYRKDLLSLIALSVSLERAQERKKIGSFGLLQAARVGYVILGYLERYIGIVPLNGNHPALAAVRSSTPDSEAVAQRRWVNDTLELENQGRKQWLETHQIEPFNGHYSYMKTLLSKGLDGYQSEQLTSGWVATPLEFINNGESWSVFQRVKPAGDLTIIPDVHEDIYGLRQSLESDGWIDSKGRLNLKRTGQLVQLGDNINRLVSEQGLSVLRLWASLADQNKKSGKTDLDIAILIGNHEKDFLLYSAADLNEKFPKIGDRLIAIEVRRLLLQLMDDRVLRMAVFVGDPLTADQPETNAIVVHAGLLPSVNEQINTVLGETLRRVPTSFEVVNYLNDELRQAYGLASSDGTSAPASVDDVASFQAPMPLARSDYANAYLFTKPRGVMEADYGFGANAALRVEAQKLGILNASGVLNAGLTLKHAQAIWSRAMSGRRQFVGHSFEYGPATRAAYNGDFVNPYVLVGDGGTRQDSSTQYPAENTNRIVFKDGIGYQVYTTTQHRGLIPRTDEQALAIVRRAAGTITELTKELINSPRTRPLFTPFLADRNASKHQRQVGQVFDFLNRALNGADIHHPAYAVRSLALLASNADLETNNESNYATISDLSDDYIFALNGNFSFYDGRAYEIAIPVSGGVGTGRLLNPAESHRTLLRSSQGSRFLRLSKSKATVLANDNPDFAAFLAKAAWKQSDGAHFTPLNVTMTGDSDATTRTGSVRATVASIATVSGQSEVGGRLSSEFEQSLQLFINGHWYSVTPEGDSVLVRQSETQGAGDVVATLDASTIWVTGGPLAAQDPAVQSIRSEWKLAGDSPVTATVAVSDIHSAGQISAAALVALAVRRDDSGRWGFTLRTAPKFDARVEFSHQANANTILGADRHAGAVSFEFQHGDTARIKAGADRFRVESMSDGQFFLQMEDVNHRQAIKDLPILVGRGQAQWRQFVSGSVSSRHFSVEIRDGRLWVTDLGSLRGTVVSLAARPSIPMTLTTRRTLDRAQAWFGWIKSARAIDLIGRFILAPGLEFHRFYYRNEAFVAEHFESAYPNPQQARILHDGVAAVRWFSLTMLMLFFVVNWAGLRLDVVLSAFLKAATAFVLGNIGAHMLMNAVFLWMGLRLPAVMVFNGLEDEMRLLNAMAYYSREVRTHYLTADKIAANAVKFLTRPTNKRSASIERDTLNEALTFLTDVIFADDRINLMSSKLSDPAVREQYFNRNDPNSTVNRLIKKQVTLLMLFLTTKEPDPVAPHSVSAASLAVHFETRRSLSVRVRDRNNEDFGISMIMPDGTVFTATLDGMGGHGHGDQAARMIAAAIQGIIAKFWFDNKDRPEVLRDARNILTMWREAEGAARAAVDLSPALRGTGAGAVLVGSISVPLGNGKYRTLVLNVGDARAYLMRPGKQLLNLTRDGLSELAPLSLSAIAKKATIAFRLLESFIGSPQNIGNEVLQGIWNNRHRTRNYIGEAQSYSSIGGAYTYFDSNLGDSMLMFTDGVVDPLSKAKIARVRFAAKNAQTGLTALLDAAQPADQSSKDGPSEGRAKTDDAAAHEISLGAFEPLANKAAEAAIISLIPRYEPLSVEIVKGELDQAKKHLQEINSILDGIDAASQAHQVVASFRGLSATYEDIIETMAPSFVRGEKLLKDDQPLGIVVYDGRVPQNTMYDGKLVLINDKKLLALDRDVVIRSLGSEYGRVSPNGNFSVQAEEAREILDLLEIAVTDRIPLRFMTDLEQFSSKAVDELGALIDKAQKNGIEVGEHLTLPDLEAQVETISENQIVQAIRNLPLDRALTGGEFRELVVLLSPRTRIVDLHNALPARPSQYHLYSELIKSSSLTRHDIAEVVPALFILEKSAEPTLSWEKIEQPRAQALRDPAPRIEISGAKTVEAANHAIAIAEAVPKKTGDVLIMAFSEAVLAELKRNAAEFAGYQSRQIRFVDYNHLPSSRAELAALAGLQSSRFQSVNVLVDRAAHLGPRVSDHLSALASDGFGVNLYLLIDEIERTVLPIVSLELSRLIELQRLIGTQA